MLRNKARFVNFIGIVVLLIPYLLYVAFVIRVNRGPVDYETFMSIGQRLLNGAEVYGENSYYPMPYVMIFAFFSWLPRPISLALWLLIPVIVALAIADWRPYVLLFAPVFGHFVGGQTAVFGLLGLWGYRRNIMQNGGGYWLALMMLKPQLGLVPLTFAIAQWWRALYYQKRIPQQAWVWLITMAVLYLPSFAVMPDWLVRWLRSPRPLFERALSGFIPRTLLLTWSSQNYLYWIVWIGLSILLLIVIWRIKRQQLNLDLLVVWGFIVSPLVHDYDLIQLVPLLETRLLQWGAVILSLPGWWVIISAYANDQAWYVFTLIAPGLLWMLLNQSLLIHKASHIPESYAK
jgi:hypothetical protein